MLCDSHIHFGQYYNYYVSSRDIVDFMQSVGVEQFAASSTTICEGKYDKVLDEMKDVVEYGQGLVVPTLWISPEMLSSHWLSTYMNSGIKWRCVKVHGFFHDWHTDHARLNEVIAIVKELKVPFLLHTGGNEYCEAGWYESLIKENKEVTFILAHARPFDKSCSILKECTNVYVDTAFVLKEHILLMVQQGLEDRVLWGTDYLVPRIFQHPPCDLTQFYVDILSTIQHEISPLQWQKISYRNFERVFCRPIL